MAENNRPHSMPPINPVNAKLRVISNTASRTTAAPIQTSGMTQFIGKAVKTWKLT